MDGPDLDTIKIATESPGLEKMERSYRFLHFKFTLIVFGVEVLLWMAPPPAGCGV